MFAFSFTFTQSFGFCFCLAAADGKFWPDCVSQLILKTELELARLKDFFMSVNYQFGCFKGARNMKSHPEVDSL